MSAVQQIKVNRWRRFTARLPMKTFTFDARVTLVFGSILVMAVLLSGCVGGPDEAGTSWERHGPFFLRFPQSVQWTPGHKKGFDEALPGYHVTGDIASFRLRPAQETMPDKLVLAITTSPGQKPHLDHFRLTVRGGHIETEPFNEGVTTTRVTWTGRERNTFNYAEKGTYFTFTTVGGEVHVILKPAVINLLQGECVVSWIDWYR